MKNSKPLVKRITTFLDGQEWVRVSRVKQLAYQNGYIRPVVNDAIEELKKLVHVGFKYDGFEYMRLYKENAFTKKMQLTVDDF